MRKQAGYVNVGGMNQDIVISKFNDKMIYEGKNIRINVSDEGTLYAITNEQGNKQCRFYVGSVAKENEIQLNYVVGQCVVNNNLVIFDTDFLMMNLETSITDKLVSIKKTTNRTDRILLCHSVSDYEFEVEILYKSSGKDTGLNFVANELIETIGVYETEDNQKVYFCDRNNPIRFISLKKDYTKTDSNGDLVYSMDRIRNNMYFCPTLALNEVYDVTKRNYGGTFHSGTIQYAFNYWNLNGQETHIMYVTPLYYISLDDRGVAPDKTCSNSFRIKVENLDTNFDYLRIYSIHRTTENATPNCRVVTDVYLRDNSNNFIDKIDFIDNGIVGQTFDPSLLLILGGDEIYCETMAYKDNVLFTGNVKTFEEDLDELSDLIRYKSQLLINGKNQTPDGTVVTGGCEVRIDVIHSGDLDENGKAYYDDHEIKRENSSDRYYPYTLAKSSADIKHWKYKETYRFGLQFQHENGLWSNAIYLADVYITKPLYVNAIMEKGECVGTSIKYNRIKVELSDGIVKKIPTIYKKVRLIYVELTADTRTVISQGILMNTIYKNTSRKSDTPYSVPDWHIRPNRELCTSYFYRTDNNEDVNDDVVASNLDVVAATLVSDLSYLEYNSSTSSSYKNYNFSPLANLHGMPVSQEYLIAPANGAGTYDPSLYDPSSFITPDIEQWYNYLSNSEKFQNQDWFNKGLSGAKYWLPVFYSRKDLLKQCTALTFIRTGALAVIKYSMYTVNDYQKPEFNLYNNNVAKSIRDQSYSPVDLLHTYRNIWWSGKNHTWLDKTSLVNNDWCVDKNIVNFFSPEVLYDDNFANIDFSKTGLRYRMAAWITDNNWAQKATVIQNSVKGAFEGESFDVRINYECGHDSRFSPIADYMPRMYCEINNRDAIEDIINTIWRNTYGYWGVLYTQKEENEIHSYHNLWHNGNSFEIAESEKDFVDNNRVDYKSYSCTSKYSSYMYSSSFALTMHKDDMMFINAGGVSEVVENITPEHAICKPVFVGRDGEKYITYQGENEIRSPFTYGREVFDIMSNDDVTNEDNGDITDGAQKFVYPIKYKTNSHIVMQLKDISTLYSPQARTNVSSIIPEFVEGNIDPSEELLDMSMSWNEKTQQLKIPELELHKYTNATSKKELEYRSKPVTVSNTLIKGGWWGYNNPRDYNGKYTQRSAFPYVWVVDLVRYEDRDEHGFFKQFNNLAVPTDENLSAHTWIPAGPKVDIALESGKTKLTLFADEGDTFIQKFDLLKTSPWDSDDTNADVTNLNSGDWNKLWTGISVWIESFVNLDGRYDSKRGLTTLYNTKFETYGVLNNVYSQLNNYFSSVALPTKIFNDNDMKNMLIWSSPKTVNELIDTWTNLYVSNSYIVLSKYGAINKLINFRNEIFGFQDNNIFRVMYNSRVQVPASDGMPVELTQGVKVPEVNYMNSLSGTTNKWSVITTESGVWYHDNMNRSINMLAEPTSDISEQTGMSSWTRKNIKDTGKYKPYSDIIDVGADKTNGFVGHYDQIRGDIYYSSDDTALSFSERLKQYESFFSYEGVKFGNNYKNQYYMTKSSYQNVIDDNGEQVMSNTKHDTVWLHHGGPKGEYFGNSADSYVEYFVNPDPVSDKVFDVFQYRADVFDTNEQYLHNETFDSVIVENEHQKGQKVLNTTNKLSSFDSDWKNKKYRIWSHDFPRQSGTMNRIRNPWIRLKLIFDNNRKYSLRMHDLVIAYTL